MESVAQPLKYSFIQSPPAEEHCRRCSRLYLLFHSESSSSTKSTSSRIEEQWEVESELVRKMFRERMNQVRSRIISSDFYTICCGFAPCWPIGRMQVWHVCFGFIQRCTSNNGTLPVLGLGVVGGFTLLSLVLLELRPAVQMRRDVMSHLHPLETQWDLRINMNEYRIESEWWGGSWKELVSPGSWNLFIWIQQTCLLSLINTIVFETFCANASTHWNKMINIRLWYNI